MFVCSNAIHIAFWKDLVVILKASFLINQVNDPRLSKTRDTGDRFRDSDSTG